VERQALSEVHGKSINIAEPSTLAKLVDEGLRANTSLEGITGLRYVALEFVDPQRYPGTTPPPSLALSAQYPAIPTIRSPFSRVSEDVAEIVRNLKGLDFAGISAEIKTVLGSANRQLTAMEDQQFAIKWSQTADAIRGLASSPQLYAALTNLSNASQEIRVLASGIDARLKPTLDRFERALADTQTALRSFSASARTLNSFLGAQTGLGEETWKTLRHLSEAAEAVQRLAEFLEQNPSAVIAGKAGPDFSKEAK
jgi:paraquat-inducible protein B